VGGNAHKIDLIHGGELQMHASISRKGFAPGELLPVHICVQNAALTKVTPRITLRQVQIFMCGTRHKAIESTINYEAVIGEPIGSHSEAQQELRIAIPADESLSIKSSVITVKYFVHVTLDIPHSLDLHIDLPVVLTSPKDCRIQSKLIQQ